MNVLVTVQVAIAWTVVLFLFHRLNIQRLRAHARLVALRRLDWDSLLDGILPTVEDDAARTASEVPPLLPDGAPTPDSLRKAPPEGFERRHALLVALVSGAAIPTPERSFQEAGFSGGEVRWLSVLATAAHSPELALDALERHPPNSAAEVYLLETLRLLHRTHVFNLELQVLGARRRMAQGLLRFGHAPSLHFGRALAASLVGWNHAAVNDLARAVYFSRTSSFYLRAVLDTPFLEEVRPELVHQCRKSWQARPAIDSLSIRGSAT